MDRSLPTQRPACHALVGLLTSEFGPAGLLVALPAVAPKACATMAKRMEDRLLLTFYKRLGYSSGGRPGIAPGSLYVDPPTGAADHQRPIQTFRILSQAAEAVKRPQKIKRDVLPSPLG